VLAQEFQAAGCVQNHHEAFYRGPKAHDAVFQEERAALAVLLAGVAGVHFGSRRRVRNQ
jgi:hypothetical protein